MRKSHAFKLLCYARNYDPSLFLTLPLSLPVPSNSSHIKESPPEFAYCVSYINKTSIRQAIHVGNLSYGSQSDAVENALLNVRNT